MIRSSGDDFKFAVIGDLHTHWDEIDLAQFSRADYDLLYFTGDLGGGTPDSTLRIARGMAGLRQPTLVMPGNNDTGDIHQLAAELAHQNGLNQLMSISRDTQQPVNPIVLCGYSRHLIKAGQLEVALLAGRPHSMGGPDLSFPDYMSETYGITSLEDSGRRLMALIDETDTEHLIFLAHNGPWGLGEEAHAIWGCDFKEGGGDWGDPDLTAAIDHARASGKQVMAVIAGHMHIRTKQGVERPWKLEIDNTLYINAARVPRIFSNGDDVYRHHVTVTISEEGAHANEVLLPQYG